MFNPFIKVDNMNICYMKGTMCNNDIVDDNGILVVQLLNKTESFMLFL